MFEDKGYTEYSDIVRWYVMRYVSLGRKQTAELIEENERRKKKSLPELEYFAPAIIVTGQGKTKKAYQQPLVLNYVFVHANLKDIKEFQQIHSNFKLLRHWDNIQETSSKNSVAKESNDTDKESFAKSVYMYVPDRDMENFIIVAKAYCNSVPTLLSSQATLQKGDKVRILDGEFCGVEGILQRRNRNGEIVMIPVGTLMMIPLLSVSPEHVEVLEFSKSGTHVYDVLDELQDSIRELMHKKLNNAMKTDDISTARYYITRYGQVKLESKKLYGRFSAMIMMLHFILDNKAELEDAVKATIDGLALVTNSETKAFVLSALYACTGMTEYFEKADEIAKAGEDIVRSKKLQSVADDLMLYRKIIHNV